MLLRFETFGHVFPEFTLQLRFYGGCVDVIVTGYQSLVALLRNFSWIICVLALGTDFRVV